MWAIENSYSQGDKQAQLGNVPVTLRTTLQFFLEEAILPLNYSVLPTPAAPGYS